MKIHEVDVSRRASVSSLASSAIAQQGKKKAKDHQHTTILKQPNSTEPEMKKGVGKKKREIRTALLSPDLIGLELQPAPIQDLVSEHGAQEALRDGPFEIG